MRRMRLDEFASSRSKEIDKLDSKADVVIEHLVKIWLFPKYHDVDTWIKHAKKAIDSKVVLKNGSYLSKDIILKTVYTDHYGQIDNYRRDFVDDHIRYGEYPGYMRSNYADNRALVDCVKKYFNRMAGKLSTVGSINIDDARKYVEDAGFYKIPAEDRN